MAQILFRQNLIMACYLLVGYWMYKKRWIAAEGSASIAKLLLYFITPMAIIQSFYTECTPERLRDLLLSFVLAALGLAVSMTVSRLLFGKKHAIETFGASFSNAGFIGIPLVQAVIGPEAVFYISGFVVLLNVLQWTYGVALLSNDLSYISVKKILANPALIAFAAGFFLFLSGLPLPSVLTEVMRGSASMNGPLAMIVLGSYLAELPFRKLFTDRITYFCALVRLLLIPAASILLFGCMPFVSLDVRKAVFIVMAAPVGANVAMFAQMYGGDYRTAVRPVCLSTVLCMVTLPLMAGAAEAIWK